VSLVHLMGKGISATSSELVAGGLGSHLDAIAGKLDIQFCTPEAALAPTATPRAASGPDPQSSNAQVP